MFVLKFGVGSLEQSVKLGRVIIFDFLGNFLLSTPLFSKLTTKKAVLFLVFSLFELFFSCGSERKPT